MLQVLPETTRQRRCGAVHRVPSVILGHIPGILHCGRMGRKGLGSPLNTLLYKSTTPWLQWESPELQSRNSLLLIQTKLEMSQSEAALLPFPDTALWPVPTNTHLSSPCPYYIINIFIFFFLSCLFITIETIGARDNLMNFSYYLRA